LTPFEVPVMAAAISSTAAGFGTNCQSLG